MGYRIRLGLLKKEFADKYKGLTFDEIQEINLNKDITIIELPEIDFFYYAGIELYDDKLLLPLFDFNETEYNGQILRIMPKEALKELIRRNKEEVISYLKRHKELLEDNQTKSMLHSIEMKLNDWENEIRPIECLDKKMTDFSIRSEMIEYEHFKYVELYNSFNWKEYCLIYEGH